MVRVGFGEPKRKPLVWRLPDGGVSFRPPAPPEPKQLKKAKPKQAKAKKARKARLPRGRPREYDVDGAITAVAASLIEGGVDASLAKFVDRVRGMLEVEKKPAPGDTVLTGI